MNIREPGMARKRVLILAASFALCFLLVGHDSAEAFTGGSWGSRGGSFGSGGSGGSWGSRGGSRGGLLGGRQPLRNLLGRLGSRLSSAGSGGSTGYSSGGSRGFGSGGSTGYSGSGGSYGSGGGSYGSYASSSSGAAYGSWGSNYLSNLGSSSYVGTSSPVYSGPLETSYAAPVYGSGMSAPMYDGGVSYGGTAIDSGCLSCAGSVDSGYLGGIPMDSGYIDQGYSLDGGLPTEGGVPMDGLQLNGGMPIEGGTVVDPSAPGSYYETTPLQGGEQATPPDPTQGGGNFPGPDDDNTSIDNPSGDTAILSLLVPRDAKVYINGTMTSTPGARRSYVSRNLKPNREYRYKVKAVVFRGGKEIVRNELVSLKTGTVKSVAMDFTSSPVTSLALNVPADAEVTLHGKTTSASGTLRHFATSKLDNGKTWNDYTVLVSVKRDGETVVQEKKLDMTAGESYSLTFDFESKVQSQIASK